MQIISLFENLSLLRQLGMCGAGDLAFSKIDKFTRCSPTHPVRPAPAHTLSPLPMPHSDPGHSTRSAATEPPRAPHPYSEDDLPEFNPMPWCGLCSLGVFTLQMLTLLFRKLQDIRAAIPSHLFVRDTKRGLAWLALDLLMAAACWKLALYIDPTFKSRSAIHLLTPLGATVARWACWLT